MCAQRLWTMVVHLWPFPRCKEQCRCWDLVHLYDWDIPVWYTNWFTMKIMCIIFLLYNIIWLVVWNMNFMTFHILGIMIPIDELIFFRGGRSTTKQLYIIMVWFVFTHEFCLPRSTAFVQAIRLLDGAAFHLLEKNTAAIENGHWVRWFTYETFFCSTANC